MSLWDPQQREWLEAMGHSLLVLAGEEPTDASAVQEGVAEVAEVGRVRGADVRGHAAGPAREAIEAAPSVRVRPAAQVAAPEEPDAPVVPRTRTDPAAKLAALEAARRAGAARVGSGPLGQALLRATGRPPAAAARMLRELMVDPSALRDDPVAKRALWLRLRALRRAAAT